MGGPSRQDPSKLALDQIRARLAITQSGGQAFQTEYFNPLSQRCTGAIWAGELVGAKSRKKR